LTVARRASVARKPEVEDEGRSTVCVDGGCHTAVVGGGSASLHGLRDTLRSTTGRWPVDATQEMEAKARDFFGPPRFGTQAAVVTKNDKVANEIASTKPPPTAAARRKPAMTRSGQ